MDFAGRRPHETEEHANGRRFARAVEPEEAVDATARNLQGDVVDRGDATECLREAARENGAVGTCACDFLRRQEHDHSFNAADPICPEKIAYIVL